MIPVKISLSSHLKGDTWEQLTIGPILINGAQPLAAAASCKMQFRNAAGVLGMTFSSSPGVGEFPITIVNAATWHFLVPATIIDLSPGSWLWDFQITDVNGVIITPYNGKLTIVQDVTHE
jgi:hypothetical protein